MSATDPAPMPPRPPLPTVPPDVELAGGPEATTARIADLVDTRDRLAAQLAVALTRVRHDDPEAFAGLPARLWLQQVCRQTRAEAGQLLRTAETLRQLPCVAVGLADGRLSWSQTVQIATAARKLPAAKQRQLDELLGAALDEYRTYEPDELLDRVWAQVDEWKPSRLEQAEKDATAGEYVSLQPNLFGGGTLIAELDPGHFALAAEALHAPLPPPTKADLDHVQPDAALGLADGDLQAAAMAQAQGRAMVDRLIEIFTYTLAGHRSDGTVIPARPTAYVVTTTDALCDRDRTPGWLLTTLAGGKMKASTRLIRQLLDERGADLRGIILDDCGDIVGVGHTTPVPPDWLREAIWAKDLVDTAPGSRTAVRRCDLDHILAFPDGPTDATNLQPLGRTPHNAKTTKDWTVVRARDGTTTWTHTPSGITIRRPPTRKRLDGTVR